MDRLLNRVAGLGLAVLVCLAAGCAAKPVPTVPEASRQLLLVVAEDWGSKAGTLQRHARVGAESPWTAVGAPVVVNLGRGGLGWGRGLHGTVAGEGPVKREGDGRAPAGVFAVGEGFAEDPQGLGPLRLHVLRADAELFCVDDPASPLYNRMTRLPAGTAAPWKSAEDMLRKDGQYRLGAYVRHNADPAVAGMGSCIFLHIWLGRGVASSGCTNMDSPDMLELLRWLDAAQVPVLAQLPRAEYERLKAAWNLPR